MSESTTIAKLHDKDAVIGVVGLGYVGLPLVLAYSVKGFRVIGFDVDKTKIELLSSGQSYIDHIPSTEIAEALEKDLLEVTDEFSRVADVDAIIICVPTPLGEHHEPDLTYVRQTIDSVAPHLRSGQIVSLESTTYPGTTEEVLLPSIEGNGHVIGEDVYLVYSPEREDPGNPDFASVDIPKVVGGVTEACLAHGEALYHAAFGTVVPVANTKVAEFAKLLENIYRSVNIGLVNELKVAADRMGIDIWSVIEAASTKPFGFKPFYPGPGLGGHCIPIDPFYLTWKAREFGIHTRFIELAGEINEMMPLYVVKRTIERLNANSKSVKGSRILIMGLAYKSDVDDMRESPTFKLLDEFKRLGADVAYYDPHIPVVTPTREHAEWTGMESVAWQEEAIRSFDCVVIATNHSAYRLEELLSWADCIVDTRNTIPNRSEHGGQVTTA